MQHISDEQVISVEAKLNPPINYRRLYREEATRLSMISPTSVAIIIARQWAVIIAVFAACLYATQRLLPLLNGTASAITVLVSAAALVFLFLAGGFVMACKQHALGVIMHDATHYRLLESKKHNNWVSDFFCAFPIGMVTASYRRGHLPHHAFTNKPLDPYWTRLSQDDNFRFPMQKNHMRRLILRDITGINLKSWWPILRAWTGWPFIFRDPEGYLTPQDRRRFTAFWIVVAGAAIFFGLLPYLLLLWVVPLLTLNMAFTRLRIIAEHDLDLNEHEVTRTRHVEATWLERLMIGPLNINYHIAHHLFPMVPLYNLPKMHKVLMQDSSFRNEAQIWQSYFGSRGIINSLLH